MVELCDFLDVVFVSINGVCRLLCSVVGEQYRESSPIVTEASVIVLNLDLYQIKNVNYGNVLNYVNLLYNFIFNIAEFCFILMSVDCFLDHPLHPVILMPGFLRVHSNRFYLSGTKGEGLLQSRQLSQPLESSDQSTLPAVGR